jgi:hypothetical protein
MSIGLFQSNVFDVHSLGTIPRRSTAVGSSVWGRLHQQVELFADFEA